jgi:hypothetical protein
MSYIKLNSIYLLQFTFGYRILNPGPQYHGLFVGLFVVGTLLLGLREGLIETLGVFCDGFIVVGLLVNGTGFVGYLVVGLLVVGLFVKGSGLVGVLVLGFLVVGLLVNGRSVDGFLVVGLFVNGRGVGLSEGPTGFDVAFGPEISTHTWFKQTIFSPHGVPSVTYSKDGVYTLVQNEFPPG